MTVKHQLSQCNVLWHRHFAHHSIQDDIEEFLIRNTAGALFIKHSLSLFGNTDTIVESYQSSRLVSKRRLGGLPVPSYALRSNMTSFEFLVSIREIVLASFLAISYSFTNKRRFDFGIGIDPVTAFVVVILRKFRFVSYVIFFPTDYTIRRLNNRFLDRMYKLAFRFTVKNSSCIWVNNKSLGEKISREIDNQLPIVYVPIGAYIPPTTKEIKEPNSIAFNRMLVKPNGADIAIKAMVFITEHFPNAKLHLIGYGPEENELKRMAAELKLGKNITFHGYKEHDSVIEILKHCEIGIAPYMSTALRLRNTDWAYADHSLMELPASIRECLALGLPMIVTKGMGFADQEIATQQVGLAADYDPKAFAKAIENLFFDRKKLETYSQNSRKYSEQFDWNRILPEAFEETFNLWRGSNI